MELVISGKGVGKKGVGVKKAVGHFVFTVGSLGQVVNIWIAFIYYLQPHPIHPQEYKNPPV
jgi:hypothetical protein